jgi:6-phosphogluconolactonase
VNVFPTPDALAAAVADVFVDDCRSAQKERGRFFVALAGGTTPKAAYGLLAQPPRRGAIDWSRVELFFGDERCVPPDDPESNYRMAREALIDAVPLPAQNVHRIRGEDEPREAARQYAQLLRETMGDLPRFDLIMLGMGPDGHTASLFPGTDPQTDETQLVRAPFVDAQHGYRVTMTPLVINNARHVLIATEGLPKAPALYAVLKGPYDPEVHPVQIVAPASGKLSWYVDGAAAAELD